MNAEFERILLLALLGLFLGFLIGDGYGIAGFGTAANAGAVFGVVGLIVGGLIGVLLNMVLRSRDTGRVLRTLDMERVLSLAISTLRENPLASTGEKNGRGLLLVYLLRLPPETWDAHPKMKQDILKILREIDDAMTEIVKAKSTLKF